MWSVTDRYLETLRHDHTRLARIEVLIDGQPVLTMEGEPVEDPITGKSILSTGGSVDVSRSNIRRSGEAVFANVSGVFSKSDIRDLFVPLRNEVRLWSGVRYWDGRPDETEWIPIGTLVIDEVDASTWPTVKVSGFDRMWIVQRSTFTEIRWWNLNRVFTVVEDMYRDALPPSKASFNFPDYPGSTAYASFDEQADRAEAGQSLALAAGFVVYVDPMGTFVASSVPEPSLEDVVVTYSEDNFNMFHPERTVAGGNAFNYVIARGDSMDGQSAAARGEWLDDNPASLTYYLDVGKLPYFYNSPLLDTNEKAYKAAATIGQREAGLTDSIVVPVIPNAAHESGDVIRVIDAEQEIDDVLIVDEFTVPLRATDGAQSLACRTQVFK